MTAQIAIADAGGLVGGATLRLLAREGFPVRAIIRNIQDFHGVPNPGGEDDVAFVPDFSPEQLDEALTGVTTLFITPWQLADASFDRITRLIEAAVRVGVPRIVLSSFQNARLDSKFVWSQKYAQCEEQLKASGVRYAIVRHAVFADDLERFIDVDGVMRSASNKGLVAPVSRADYTRLCAAVVRFPERFDGQTLTVTGPDLMPLEEALRCINGVRGTAYGHQEQTLGQARRGRAAGGTYHRMSPDVMASAFEAIADGEVAFTSDDLRRVLGVNPRQLADALRERPSVQTVKEMEGRPDSFRDRLKRRFGFA